jgi:undecaprenyl-diphosphatase
MTAGARLYAAAAVLLVLFVLLGAAVSRGPLGAWDARAVHFRAQATPLALIFTKSGRSKALTIGYIVAVAVYAVAHLAVWVPLLLAASQMISQLVVEGCKALYKRTRPDYWLVGLDAGHSYPSGHAATAVITFLGWAAVAAYSGLPAVPKNVLIAMLALWATGIVWSRLALGAHYLSDVAGGALFGAAWLCLLASLVSPLLR